MITGEKYLRQLYPNLDEKQYQPAGIDLTLGAVYVLEYDENVIYGLFKDVKVLPKQVECQTVNLQIDGALKTAFKFQPHIPYIVQTAEKIKISKNAGQFYFARSSALRSGIELCTAFGDPGFYGHLSFLLINHTDELFFIEKGARFAQLVDISANNVESEYNGDYSE